MGDVGRRGLQGDRFATVSKVHHCMLDGISGVDLAHVLFSPKPDYEIQEAPRYVPHQAPSHSNSSATR